MSKIWGIREKEERGSYNKGKRKKNNNMKKTVSRNKS